MVKFLLLSIILLNQSCVYFKALVDGVKEPDIEITSVEIAKADFTKINVNIDLNLTNPNNFDIKLKRIRYKASYKKLKLASGERDELLKLPANGESKIRLGLRINPAVLLFGANEFLEKGGAKVRLKARAVFETP